METRIARDNDGDIFDDSRFARFILDDLNEHFFVVQCFCFINHTEENTTILDEDSCFRSQLFQLKGLKAKKDLPSELFFTQSES